MIYQYAVSLKNASRSYIDRLTLLLLLISVCVFLQEQLKNLQQVKITYLFGTLAIAFIAGRNLYAQRLNPHEPVYYRIALYIASITWLTMPYLPWLFIPFAALGLFEKQAKLPLEIGFTDNAVVINTLFRRYYQWTDFNNIVLKDDILTLDFKNNRLLQRETVDEEGDAGEDEFNDYCRDRLAKAHSVMS